MIFNMVGFGGGGGLRISVKAYASPEALPTSEAENAIAVITGTAISNVALSPEEPVTKSTGTVWIPTSGGDISIGVDEQETIILHPNQCMQWDGNQWETCDAFVFQSGKWISFATAVFYLYRPGNTYESITGGWVSEGKKSASSGGGTAHAPTITEGTDSIVFTQKGSNYLAGIVYMKNSFDLTDYNTISLTSSRTTTNDRFCVWTSIGTYGSSNTVIYEAVPNGTQTFDVSGLSGVHNIGFLLSSGSSGSVGTSITLSEMKLLP